MNFSLDVNFLAFFLSGLLAYGLNIVWYHPKILGSRWIEVRTGGKGRRAADASPWTGPNKSPVPYIATFFLWTLSACFYSFLCSFLDVNSASGFFCIACLLWVAFAMPPILMNALNTGYPFEAMAIDAGCQLGGYYIFAAVHIVFLTAGLM